MAEALPKFDQGDWITLVATTVIAGGQVVEITGDNTVGATTGTSSKVIGVAARDAAIGDLVVVSRAAVWEIVATGTINAGEHVTSSTTGGVATIGAGVFGLDIGVCLKGATVGNKALVALNLS